MTILHNFSETSAGFKIKPFARYDISMNTTCVFGPDISTSGVSEKLDILAATREFLERNRFFFVWKFL